MGGRLQTPWLGPARRRFALALPGAALAAEGEGKEEGTAAEAADEKEAAHPPFQRVKLLLCERAGRADRGVPPAST